MKNVALFFANGTEEVEALTPYDYLLRAGANVTIVGVDTKNPISSHKVKITTEVEAKDVVDEDFDLVIAPGGMPGSTNILNSDACIKIIKKAYDNGKHVAAICAAPMVLGKLGLLNGKEATCYPGFENDLIGAKVVNKKAVTSENVTTGKGAGASQEFALELVSVLFGKEVSEKIALQVQYK